MATGSLNREFTSDELDALAAAELPVQDALIPPSATTAPAAASGAPEPTGSAGLITGEGALPARGPAIGPVAQLEAREYTTEEIDFLERDQKQKEFSTDDLDQKIVASVYDDPTYIPTRDEYFQAKELKARLKSEGKIPGLLENAATGAGQFLQTLGSSFHEIVDDPGEFLARSPATMKATAKKSWRNTNDVTRWIRQANAPQPIGRDEQTGEFVFGQVGAGRSDAEVLASQQRLAAEQGRTIRPVTEEDLKDEEFDRFIMERSRQKELEEWVASTTAPTEFLTRLTTGRNQIEQPMQATSDIAGGLLEPTNVATMAVPFSAGAKTLGASRLAKEFGAGGARILERAAARGIDGMEAGAFKFQEIIQKGTRITPENQVKIAKWSAAGGIGGGVFGLDTDVPVLSQAQDGARFIGGSYLAYKFGLGTLRSVQKVAGPTSTILRVAANPAEGFDDIAQASVAAKLNAFPELSAVREIVENPTRFRPIESTPARLAADPRLGPQTRAIADALSNPLIVQGVRGASAVAGGAVKGAAFNAPFVALALNADEEKAAANMLGLGAGFGAFGGAVNRFTGVQQRRTEARASDTARMFLDVELAGGDVGKLAETYSPQQLGDLASMQGFFRDKVQFVPLNKADFDTNTQALGGAGAAGLFVQAPPGEKARIFINLDAKRDGIVPHELGHALIKSGALGSAQTDSIRAFTTRRYTQAGVEARAREYATTIIQNENAAKFPGQNLPVSAASITAKMDELGQSGMLRGDIDPLDWARDEIFAEDFRQASQTMDFAAIRRNLPADGSWLGSMENLLAAQANALSISGVRIDPATGQPDPLFKANPILATDPVLKKQLGQYLNNYREWINHPDQTKARGVRVAPMARPQDLVNNPQITFHDYGGGVMANEFARIDPATGQAVFRDQRDINAETAKRQQQIKTLAGSKLMPATDPNLGPKKTADGRVTVRGRILPQQFDFLNGFAQHQRAFARQFETAAANGESMMTRYHAIGTGDSGAFRIKNLGNLEAITREVIPWGWELTSKGNLLASVLDLTQFRNRAIKAINAGDPTLGRLYNNDLKAIESDLKQWMDNHRQDLPGSNKIGEQRRDAINSLIGIATNINRAANPFSGKIAGPSSAIKQFRLDRLDTTAPTGRTGFHFDYDKANGNLLPEVATPLPDLSRDLPGQAIPDAVDMPVKLGNQNFMLRPAGMVSMPGQAFPAYHGTPHKVDKFSLDKIGTGEGAQAYGWGLYFAQNKGVAKNYRDALSGVKLLDAKGDVLVGLTSNPVTQKILKEAQSFWKNGETTLPSIISEITQKKRQAELWASSGSNVQSNTEFVSGSEEAIRLLQGGSSAKVDGNLYTVDLDVKLEDLFDWDKPFSEQSPKVQAALKAVQSDHPLWNDTISGKNGKPVGGAIYKTLTATWPDAEFSRDGIDPKKKASEALLAAGIPGIRYLDGDSRNSQGWKITPPSETVSGKWMVKSSDYNSKGLHFDTEAEAKTVLAEKIAGQTYNYVVFDENLIKIKAENGQPVSTQEFAQAAGQAANGREIIRLSLDNGVFNYSKQ